MKTSRFAQYAAEESKRRFVGTLIKFVKREWQMGADRDLISPDKLFVAAMDTLTVGYIKWSDGQPVDSRMGLVADGFRPPHRGELDDLDNENWEVGENNDRIDPWQRTTLLVLVSATAARNLFTFTTGTAGGQSAIGDLCEAHARTTEGAGQYPVVTLATDSYQHKIPSRGRIDIPVFKIVDCVEAAPYNATIAEARGGAGFIPTSPLALETARLGRIALTSGRPRPPEPPEDSDDPPEEYDDPPSPDPDDPGPSPDPNIP